MAEGDLRLTDPRALRALAHPARLAILERLQGYGPATATQCGDAAGVSPSAASYHLRALARWGLVEDAGGGRGRERPWRARATGFAFEMTGSPAHEAAASLLGGQLVARGNAWTAEYIESEPRLPPEWRRASHVANKRLRLTPEEAEDVVRRIEELLAPYGIRRDEAPEDARVVRLLLRLFPAELP